MPARARRRRRSYIGRNHIDELLQGVFLPLLDQLRQKLHHLADNPPGRRVLFVVGKSDSVGTGPVFGAAFDRTSAFADLGPQGPCETGSPRGSWWMLDEITSVANSISRAFGRLGIFTEARGWEDADS